MKSFIAVVFMLALLFPAVGICGETPGGCYVWKTTTTVDGQESMDKEDVCQNGMCKTYYPPDCPGCEVEICYNAVRIECEQYSCDVFYGTPPAGTSFIPCSTPPQPSMSSTHARKCRPIGNAVAFACTDSPVCAACPSYSAWIDTYINGWMVNSAWTSLGSYTCSCHCWNSPPGCACTPSPGE